EAVRSGKLLGTQKQFHFCAFRVHPGEYCFHPTPPLTPLLALNRSLAGGGKRRCCTGILTVNLRFPTFTPAPWLTNVSPPVPDCQGGLCLSPGETRGQWCLASILGNALLLGRGGGKTAMALRKSPSHSLAGVFCLVSSGCRNLIAWASAVLLGVLPSVGPKT